MCGALLSFTRFGALFQIVARTRFREARELITNPTGDIISVYNNSGTKLVNYTYNAWGETTISYVNGGLNTNVKKNPFRYRGYYYDTDLGMYYLQSRYYDVNTGRFINPDSIMSGVNGSLHGFNLYVYCFNNPVNLTDSSGNWPKWLTGALNVAGGAMQMMAGAALGATVGWTGIGAVAASILIANGAATVVQGVGQTVNDISNSEIMREDNIIRTVTESIGESIGGEVGAKVAGYSYDVLVLASSAYASGVAIKQAIEQEMPNIVNSKLFSHNGGRGFKIGKSIEIFYQNPRAAGGPGGTIFSYKGIFGKFRIDWDPAHGFHMHPPGH